MSSDGANIYAQLYKIACSSSKNISDAFFLCRRLGIPFNNI
ncbi:Hypothetical protein GbCGDNIH9_8620 [Granulibacter bethesdensis]|uniref:Uncharacterized protein n=1 Tax=Granulibacter bethesdensis TaxID=364410 RepID=A0AAC9P8X3_9PROT|nr:Hypothetical protein GbCGDNIH9_8620 [Granulibacter bethesdensis]APH62549.1 Hypothetical protein GbCGDNIH8_8620 [Granulibacter bethesdensis]